jgi:uncharacterized OB-fold protein
MVWFAQDGRPLAEPTPLAAPFFDALREGHLLLPCCPRDGFFFYPRNRCPACLKADWTWQQTSGRGQVYSFTVDRIGHDPALAASIPLVIAIVELVEGPRVPANIVDCPCEGVSIGMAVEVAFSRDASASLLLFRRLVETQRAVTFDRIS